MATEDSVAARRKVAADDLDLDNVVKVPTSSVKPARRRVSRGVGDGLAEPPWSRVRRVQLIRREIREYLSASAVELLLSTADHVVEGGSERDTMSSPVYASLMATIDLEMAAEAFREPADAATAQRVAELMAEHDLVHAKLLQRATAELAGLVGVEPDALEISLEYEVRAEACKVFLDADVEASPRRRRRS
jgi:hypothetical protein